MQRSRSNISVSGAMHCNVMCAVAGPGVSAVLTGCAVKEAVRVLGALLLRSNVEAARLIQAVQLAGCVKWIPICEWVCVCAKISVLAQRA